MVEAILSQFPGSYLLRIPSAVNVAEFPLFGSFGKGQYEVRFDPYNLVSSRDQPQSYHILPSHRSVPEASTTVHFDDFELGSLTEAVHGQDFDLARQIAIELYETGYARAFSEDA